MKKAQKAEASAFRGLWDQRRPRRPWASEVRETRSKRGGGWERVNGGRTTWLASMSVYL